MSHCTQWIAANPSTLVNYIPAWGEVADEDFMSVPWHLKWATEFSWDFFQIPPFFFFRNLSSKVLRHEASKQASQPAREEGRAASHQAPT